MARKYSCPAVRVCPAFSASSAWPTSWSVSAVQARRKSAVPASSPCWRGLLDRPAGAVDLVDQAAGVERRDDAQVPDVVAGEVLEHGGASRRRGAGQERVRARAAAGRAGWAAGPGRPPPGCGSCRCPRRSSRRHRRRCSGGGAASPSRPHSSARQPPLPQVPEPEHVPGEQPGAAAGVDDQLLERPAHVGQQVLPDQLPVDGDAACPGPGSPRRPGRARARRR